MKALELIVEKCASTIEGGNKSASAILLRIFECIASGLLLEGMSAPGAITAGLVNSNDSQPVALATYYYGLIICCS